MHDGPWSTEEEQWVIWNGSYGIADMVTISRVEVGNAWLDEPYDMVGPFSLDELETTGWISFAACIVMSRQRWQEDQMKLRQESYQKRCESQQRIYEELARANARRKRRPNSFEQFNEKEHRELLCLPIDGELESAQIKSAYRRLVKKVHPDVGGSHEEFIRITEARDALLKLIS